MPRWQEWILMAGLSLRFSVPNERDSTHPLGTPPLAWPRLSFPVPCPSKAGLCGGWLAAVPASTRSMWLTFPHHGHADGHAHELALGPDVGIDAHAALLALTVEPRNGWVVGHLLSHEAHTVAARCVGARGLGPGGVPQARSSVSPLGGPHPVTGHLPRAVKALPQHGVVGLLGHSALAALMEGGQVVLHEAHDPLLRRHRRGDAQEKVRVRHEVSVHLQQGAFLQDEGG
ncbi:hypothetical protein JZ751_009664 [Albula glossodonta]|uniref:Uncharacterized protein n=1 Tax=Albula glossodonta TaxID=121402 RepID=A0A8T2P192_9TELE|nr:hypothetical protein JZ751_009664 [Albula glossodonta]